MKPNFDQSVNNFLKTFSSYEIGKDNQEAFIEKALEIHSLISLKLAKCPHIEKKTLKQALSLIDELDSILGSAERISKSYSDSYQALLEILIRCDLAKKLESQIAEKLSVAPKDRQNLNTMGENRMNREYRQINIAFFVMLFSFLIVSLVSDPSFAVTIVKLQEPIRDLKAEIFGGWMMVVKIAAAAAGIILSAFRGSLAPFGIGAGISAGIHMFDKYLGNGADGALI